MLLVKTIDVNEERQLNPSARNASRTTPAEIAAVILYLATDDAGVVNGARIPLFGGMS